MINIKDVPYLLTLDGTPVKALNNREHLEIEHVDDVSSIMTLTLDLNESIISEQQILYRNNRYIVSEIEEIKSDRNTIITAEINYLELADDNISINEIDAVLQALATKLLKNTGWTVGRVDDTQTKHNITQYDVSALSVLRLMARISETKLVFDTINKTVNYIEVDSNNLGFLFRYQKNLQDIKKTTYKPRATTLIPYGKGGLTIESVNNRKKYVEDFSWYESLGYTTAEARKQFNKTHTFEDERFVYAGNLMREAERRLMTLSHPQIAYDIDVAYLERDVKIGDYGFVDDEELDIKVNVKIVRMIEYEDINDNTIELNYLVPGLMDNQEDLSEGGSHEAALSTIFVQNESDFNGEDTYRLLLQMVITNYASTHAQAGLAIVGQSTGNGLLEAYFSIDGERLALEVKQALNEGYNTIGLPFMITALQEGSHRLDLFLKVTDSTFTIDRHDAQLFVQAENLAGGLGTGLPNANVVEEVEFIDDINVTDGAIAITQIPINVNVTEEVEFIEFDVTDYVEVD